MKFKRYHMYNITLIPGDGVGPEVTEALLHIIEMMDIEFGLYLGLCRRCML
jgi:isocitrate/isopropylmalate dehydrogenase